MCNVAERITGVLSVPVLGENSYNMEARRERCGILDVGRK
jgi:hypothetical protein